MKFSTYASHRASDLVHYIIPLSAKYLYVILLIFYIFVRQFDSTPITPPTTVTARELNDLGYRTRKEIHLSQNK